MVGTLVIACQVPVAVWDATCHACVSECVSRNPPYDPRPSNACRASNLMPPVAFNALRGQRPAPFFQHPPATLQKRTHHCNSKCTRNGDAVCPHRPSLLSNMGLRPCRSDRFQTAFSQRANLFGLSSESRQTRSPRADREERIYKNAKFYSHNGKMNSDIRKPQLSVRRIGDAELFTRLRGNTG